MKQTQTRYIVALVDDDHAMQAAIGSLLKSDGFDVETFGSAEDFLLSPLSQTVHCLVLDLLLPGMSGLELLRQLSGCNSAIQTICLTGQKDGDGRIRELALQMGARVLFYKPFDAQELLSAVRSICVGGRIQP